MPVLSKTLSVPELRLCVSILDEEIHPSAVFFCLHQCRMQRKLNGSWPDVRCNELDMLIMYYVTQRHQAQTEALQDLENILAKNQNTPLTSADSVELFRIMKVIEQHYIDWKTLPITKRELCEIIELAACGYQHQAQVA